MDKKIKVFIATLGSLLTIGAGIASYSLGWWNLPKAQADTAARVETIEKKLDNTDANLNKLIAIQTAEAQSQKQLNDVLIATLKRNNNG